LVFSVKVSLVFSMMVLGDIFSTPSRRSSIIATLIGGRIWARHRQLFTLVSSSEIRTEKEVGMVVGIEEELAMLDIV
jgi:hypothetical protein